MFWELKKIMKKKNITNGMLAEILEITPNSLINKLKGKTDFNITEIYKIQNLFLESSFEKLFLKEE